MFVKLMMVFLFDNVICTDTARILAYYPCPAFSHQMVFRTITLELLQRGHQMTVITTDPMFTEGSRPVNLTEIDVHDVSYRIYNKLFIDSLTGDKIDIIKQGEIMMNVLVLLFEEHFKAKEVQGLLRLKKEYFDLILLEAIFPPGLGLSHTFRAPVILISSFGPFPGNYETVGAPTHPTIYHDFIRQKLYNLTVWEKIIELVNHLRTKILINHNEEKQNKVLQKIFGPDIPPMSILKNNVHMLFVNINPIWEGNYPVPPSVVHMGGLHQKPPKELPKDLKDYLDSSKKGMIYFSFGTNINPSLLPPEKIDIFSKVFSELPYNVIWKWDNESFPVKSTNIKIYKWVPQSDILKQNPKPVQSNARCLAVILLSDCIHIFLQSTFKAFVGITWRMEESSTDKKYFKELKDVGRVLRVNDLYYIAYYIQKLGHPNVKLFITQGGLQSTDESITGGVPLIGIPMLGDQWYNVEKYVYHKIGVRLDLEDLTESRLKSAIIQVAEDETYRKNILRLRSQMEDQPQTPMERSIWWIEYVLRHKGAKHLRAPTANMPWSEFLELELVSAILFMLLVTLGLLLITLRTIVGYLLKKYMLYMKLKKS